MSTYYIKEVFLYLCWAKEIEGVSVVMASTSNNPIESKLFECLSP